MDDETEPDDLTGKGSQVAALFPFYLSFDGVPEYGGTIRQRKVRKRTSRG